MKKALVLLTLCFFFTAPEARPQGVNPFARLLPREEEVVEDNFKEAPEAPEVTSLPADLVLQGVFWGVKNPQAIINGKVYAENEKLEGTKIEVIKIEDGAVHLLYGKRIFVLYPKMK